jgi:Acetyltransferase (GNAT) family
LKQIGLILKSQQTQPESELAADKSNHWSFRPSQLKAIHPAMATWRRMSVSDIKGVLTVADEIHPDLPESDRVFAERTKIFPKGCLVLVEGGEVCGYVISHPIRQGQPPALDTLLGELATDADQYYIHDLAILSRLRGRGLTAVCIEQLFVVAGRYPTTCLVSVYGTAPFWARYGFEAVLVDEALSRKLRDYGADAIFLSRRNGQ